jgi:alkanesulfonate monooxygenase SsuD/methylene tetrahydromethanopterin reductase-like flavin-dependent oxidoreductase (luciferase family)
MRFGLFGGGKIGRMNPLGDSHGYRDFIEYIKDADRLGYESLFVVEHHFTGVGQLSASLNLLTYLAAVTKRIRLGTAVVVLPWHNPALLAEQVATLDVLSGGRVDFGIGRGYRKAEFDQFCIPIEEAQERFDECLEFILRAWTTEGRFTHESKHWKYKNIVVEPTPTQKPHPPIWMAGGSLESITRVANSNFNLLLDQVGSIALTFERLRTYLDAQEKQGRARDASRVGVARALHVIRSESERRKALERRAENLKTIGELARKPGSTDPLVDDGALIGTPAEIIDKLQRLAAGGVEYVLLTNAVVTRESLLEFYEEIMPHVSAPATSKPSRAAAAA